MPVDELTMVLRIGIAAGLGLLIGLDREIHGRAAGLRTCLLVSMSGALLMSLSLYLAQIFAGEAAASTVRLDPGRLPSYAIAGMGFLGAGAIIQGKLRSRGVTTGAAMWACTGIGLAVGAGLYLPAVFTVAITMVALSLLRVFARRLPHEQHVTLEVDILTPKSEEAVRKLLDSFGARIYFTGRERCLESNTAKITFTLVVHSGNKWTQMLSELDQLPGISCYAWHESEVP